MSENDVLTYLCKEVVLKTAILLNVHKPFVLPLLGSDNNSVEDNYYLEMKTGEYDVISGECKIKITETLLKAIEDKDKNLAELIQKFMKCYIAWFELTEVIDETREINEDAINNVLRKFCDEPNKSIDYELVGRLRSTTWSVAWNTFFNHYENWFESTEETLSSLNAGKKEERIKNFATDWWSEFDKLTNS
ncbi:MAG: hypothetical protein Q8Q54_04995 [Methylococcales bacterium]|nr:hypothetical protein [Methylococcales bacterium]MDP3838261.1 hypothetical protein [Methylococcales bacterium]